MHMTLFSQLGMRRLSAAIIGSLIASSSYAATWTVASTASGTTASPVCSGVSGDTCTLQDALEKAAANADATQTIQFSSAIQGKSILDSFIISNPGFDNKTLTIDGSAKGMTLDATGRNSSVLTVFNPLTLNLQDLTLTGGNSPWGGGLEVAANADERSNTTLTRCVVAGNTAEYWGGGISIHWSTLTINQSNVFNNTAEYGGGISGYESVLDINQSSIFNNTADYGGAIEVWDSMVTLDQSTLSHNQSTSFGGAMWLSETSKATMLHSTVAYNYSPNIVGAIAGNPGSAITLLSSIIADNPVKNAEDLPFLSDISYSIAVSSLGHNLIGDGNGLSGFVDTDQVGSDATTGYLHAGVAEQLADNGGFTQTLAVLEGSPAIGNGDCSTSPAVTTDQRGVTRATPCTVGAFEFEPEFTNLSASAGTYSAACKSADCKVSVSFNVKNSGNTAIETYGLAARFYLSSDSQCQVTDLYQGFVSIFTDPATMPAASEETFNLTLSSSRAQLRGKTLCVQVDGFNGLSEDNETDNWAQWKITL